MVGSIADLRNLNYQDEHNFGRGLRAKANKDGSVSWFFRQRMKGYSSPIYMQIGYWPGISIDEAEDKARVYRALIAKGVHPKDYEAEQADQKSKQLTAKDAKTITLQDLLSMYEKSKELFGEPNSSRTMSDRRNGISSVFGEWLDKPISEITEEVVLGKIEEWIFQRGRRGRVIRVCDYLSAIYNFAVTMDYLGSNPFEIRKDHIDKGDERVQHLNEATKKNLRRKSQYVDNVQMDNNIPLFSWIDINVTELCNRTCIFCPRADENFYPNQNLHISLDLVKKIAAELNRLQYQGAIVLSGFGEPLLHPGIIKIVSILAKEARIEIVTNGDHLNSEMIKKLFNAGAAYFVVSMYDGPHQISPFREMFEEADCDDETFLLRDRWHSQKDGYGLKLTNRAGTIHVGDQDPIDVTHPCHYPAYSMTVDWNGDVLLCVQDWNKKVKLGNIFSQSLVEIWTSSAFSKRRIQLVHGDRKQSPCALCNADGTLHGYNHVKAWGIEK